MEPFLDREVEGFKSVTPYIRSTYLRQWGLSTEARPEASTDMSLARWSDHNLTLCTTRPVRHSFGTCAYMPRPVSNSIYSNGK